MTPIKIAAKDFEKLCMLDATWSESHDAYTMGRYGSQFTYREERGQRIAQPMRSLPDFEGVLPGGRQFIIEAKVVSGSRLDIHDDKFKARQLSHLLSRARFGAVTLLLLHFNERRLIRSLQPAMTIAFPVRESHPFWRQHARGELASIGRTDATLHGHTVEWWVPQRVKIARPHLLPAVLAVAAEMAAREAAMENRA